MVEINPELVVIIMFSGIFIGILMGYPLSIVLAGVGMCVGVLTIGGPAFNIFHLRILGFMSSYTLLALPLFAFMGTMVEKSGTAERLYAGLYLLSGRLRGGLAIGSILMGTILAACVGVVSASVIMIGLIATPSMLRRRYSKELISGCVCAGGSLGILIPPSIMLVLYGPMAALSVGKLFMGAFMPGLLLSGLYVTYILIHSWIRPHIAPAISVEEAAVPWRKKAQVLLTAIVPPILLIIAVLGSIFFGFAAATEAAAVGALASILLAAAYRRLNWTVFKESLHYTMRFACITLFIGWGAQMFVGVFLKLGGGDVISELLLAVPGGKWGSFAMIMFIVFLLGFIIDWIGILFIMIPIISPIGDTLGFDPIWFALMICVNLQMSFLTPPLAPAIFNYKAIIQPEWGITDGNMMRGVIPFVCAIIIALGLCVTFPQIITWLPATMIK